MINIKISCAWLSTLSTVPPSILLPLYCTELNTAKYNLVWNGTPMLPYILFFLHYTDFQSKEKRGQKALQYTAL